MRGVVSHKRETSSQSFFLLLLAPWTPQSNDRYLIKVLERIGKVELRNLAFCCVG